MSMQSDAAKANAEAMLIVRACLNGDRLGALHLMQQSDYPESVFIILAELCALLLHHVSEDDPDSELGPFALLDRLGEMLDVE